MNILIITEYFPKNEEEETTGGVETRCLNEIKELSKKHKVFIITSWRKGLKREQKIFGAKVYRVGMNHKYSNKGSVFSRLMFAIFAYKKGILLKNIDVVNGYSFISYLPALKISKKLNIPRIITYSEVWKGRWIKIKGFFTGILGELWEGLVLKSSWDKIVAISDETKNQLMENGILEDKIALIYNGIDIDKINKIKTPKNEKFTLITVSRLTKDKRINDVINAVDVLIHQRKINIDCKIIGRGPEFEKIKKLIKDKKLSDNVFLLGFVKKHEDVIKELKKSHLFVFPSILEGFGSVLIEAMASGLPYVCSDIPVFKKITENGKGGLFFNAKNSLVLAEKIEVLIKDKKIYTKKQKEAINYVKRFDSKNVFKKMLDIYEEVVDKK